MAGTTKHKQDPGGWDAYDRSIWERHHGSPERSLRLLRQAAAAGNAIAMHNLFLNYEDGAAADRKLRNLWFGKLAAAAGNPLAQRSLGKHHLHCKPVNLAEARHWLTRAVRAGDPGAWFLLNDQLPHYAAPRSTRERARRHEREERYALAVPLLEYCARRGDVSAQSSLVDIYRRDRRGVRRDRRRRRYWIRRLIAAALHGNALAQRDLAFSYLFADGFRQNLRFAKHWLLCAAQNGDADAQLHVYTYSLVFGLSEDEAQSWFLKAVANGDPGALWQHGCQLLEAEGKPTARILELFRRAARGGCPPAIDWLDRWRDRQKKRQRTTNGATRGSPAVDADSGAGG